MLQPLEIIKAEYQRVFGLPCEDLNKVTQKIILTSFEIYADQYKDLLEKYIKHIVSSEGVDFITNGLFSEIDFTEEEEQILIQLARK